MPWATFLVSRKTTFKEYYNSEFSNVLVASYTNSLLTYPTLFFCQGAFFYGNVKCLFENLMIASPRANFCSSHLRLMYPLVSFNRKRSKNECWFEDMCVAWVGGVDFIA